MIYFATGGYIDDKTLEELVAIHEFISSDSQGDKFLWNWVHKWPN